MLAAAIDEKDPYTRGHSGRVARYSTIIGHGLGMSAEDLDRLRIAALLHDVGKIGVDDRVLKKPGQLTDEEFDLMKQHTIKGANIMRPVAQLKDVLPGIELHHERMDGKGYPYGLPGDQIPLMARIIAVADTLDAITTNRPYQSAMDLDFALERIRSLAISRFDPEVVAALETPSKRHAAPQRHACRSLIALSVQRLFCASPRKHAVAQASSARMNFSCEFGIMISLFGKPEPTLLEKLKQSVSKTRTELAAKVEQILTGDRPVDPALLKELESALLGADIGVTTTKEVLAALREQVNEHKLEGAASLKSELKNQITKNSRGAGSRDSNGKADTAPRVLFVVGVNGTGKTTTIGKLANRLKKEGAQRDALRRGHVSRGGHRATGSLGEALGRGGDQAEVGLRSFRGDF